MPLENRIWWGLDDEISHRSVWAFHPLDGVRSSKLEIDCVAGITTPYVRNRPKKTKKDTAHITSFPPEKFEKDRKLTHALALKSERDLESCVGLVSKLGMKIQVPHFLPDWI
jgi:hypothetical protein